MKTLIVFTSRTGRTKKVAEELAKLISADSEEIKELKSRKGIWGYLKAGHDAMLKKATSIEKITKNPADYDLVVVATPIWAFTMSCPIRTWLEQYGKNLQRVAFIATMGGSGDKKAFAQMQELCGHSPLATLTFIDKKIDRNLHLPSLRDFAKNLTSVRT